MATTPTLGLTLMSASQAQKEVVFNEALLAFDSLFRGVVLSAALSTPPASPNEGDTYIIAGGASGAWSAQDRNIAFYFNGWQFVTAKNQMRLYDQAANVWRVYHASTTSWDAEPASTVSVLTDLTNVQGMPANGQVLTFVAADGKWEPKNPVFTAALNTLTDVNVTEGGSIDGYALIWNNTDHKWEAGAVLTAKPGALSLPDVTIPTGVRDGWFAVYNATGPGVKFVDPTTVTIVRSLQNVGDVAYPTGGSGAIASGAYLQWNGAAWVPSTSAVSISVQSLSNGPGSFSGNASKLLRVDSTESKLEYTTLALSTLPDVNVSEGAGIDGYTLVWSNATSKWVAAAHSSASLAGLTDVQITEGAGIDGQVLYWKNSDSRWESKALAAVAVSGAYGDLSGKPSLATVALSGAYADLAGKPSLATVATSGAYDDLSGKPTLAAVAISGAYGDLTGKPTNGSWSLAGLADVSMSPGSENDGYVVYWDNATTRFKLKAVSGGSSSLATLTDVSVTESSGIDGKFLKWDNASGKWIADTPLGGGGGVIGTLAGATDVSISSPSDGQVLTYNAATSKWKNSAVTGGGGGTTLLPPHYELGSFAPPSSTWFTTSQGASGATAALTDVANRGLHIKTQGTSSDNSQIIGAFRDCSGWGSNWSVTVRMVAGPMRGNYPNAGIGLVDAAGKAEQLIAIGTGNAVHLIHNYWNNTGSFSGNDVDVTMDGVLPTWLRIRYDGAYLYWCYSYDGLSWWERKKSKTVWTNGSFKYFFISVSGYSNDANFSDGSVQGSALVTHYDDPDYPAVTHMARTSASLGDLANVNTSVTPATGRLLAFNGTSGKWEDVQPPGVNQPPSTALFTYTANGVGASLIATLDSVKGLSVMRTDTGPGNDIASVFCKNVPSGSTWTVTARVKTVMHNGAYVRGGLCLHNSTSKKTMIFGIFNFAGTTQLGVFYMSDLNTFSSGGYSANLPPAQGLPEWFKISWDGTNYTFAASFDDGISYTSLATLAASSYFTADKVGFGIEAYQSFVAAGVLCKFYNDPDIPAATSYGTVTGPTPFIVSASITGVALNSETVLQYVAPQSFTIPAGASGSFAKANSAATGSATFTIKKNGAAVGTIAFPASGTTGTFTFATTQTFSAGDVLQLIAPSTADSALADIGITLYGTKG